jgi:hypothetical protein
VSRLPDHAGWLGSEPELIGTLFVLFIPSRDKNGNSIPDQQVWAATAAKLLSDLFGGATEMPPARGRWLNEETGEIITEEVILIHCYVRSSHVNDEAKVRQLADFLHRMGRETKQGEVAVVIGDVLHRIRRFTRRGGRGK